MLKTFIIQSRIDNNCTMPAQEYGYTAIQAINYTNWYQDDKVYSYILVPQVWECHLNYNYIPIGSVEFVTRWLQLMGVKSIKPLNIPPELWKFCEREIKIDYCKNINGHWFLKSTSEIKCADNGEVWFNGDGGEDKKYFLTKWLDNVVSEWRIFVYNGNIVDIRCYSGDQWVLPNKAYVEEVVKAYDKKCYTLDVMVCADGHTEILELHDFFACALYGVEDFMLLPKMWITTIKDLLRNAT